jgi:hypothetical protein
MYLNLLEKQEQVKSQSIRQKEAIKTRAEINKMEIKRTIQRINKTKSYFFEKINKTDKILAKIKRTREKTQIDKIKDEKGDITTNTNEIHQIIMDYFEKLYKLENIGEKNKFLHAYDLTKPRGYKPFKQIYNKQENCSSNK